MELLKKLKPKGGDVVDLRVKKTISKNGTGACLFIPADFMKELKWEALKTEVYLTLTERGEMVLTPVAQIVTAKAS